MSFLFLTAPTTSTSMIFDTDNQPVPRSPCDNGRYNRIHSTNISEESASKSVYGSSHNEAQPSKKMSFPETDFYVSENHEELSSKIQHTREVKLPETTLQGEESMRKIFSAKSGHPNGLQKPSILGFNGGNIVLEKLIR